MRRTPRYFALPASFSLPWERRTQSGSEGSFIIIGSFVERLDRIERSFGIEIRAVLVSIARVLKFLGKYREAGLLLLRASVGLIFILICAPVLLSGEYRWGQFGSAMRVFNFHSHLDWWGFFGALIATVGGIFMILGFAFRIGLLLTFLVALVNAINVSHHQHGLYPILIPIEAVIVLVCLSFIGPGKYSVDKG